MRMSAPLLGVCLVGAVLLAACPDSSPSSEGGLSDALGGDVGGIAPTDGISGADAPDGAACVPSCGDKVCGGDGCGGSCGSCGEGKCVGGSCVPDGPCVPDCADAACGADGCGGSCGTCVEGWDCKAGQCVDPGGPLTCGDGTCADDEDCTGCPDDCGPCGSSSCTDAVACLLGCTPDAADCIDACLKPATEVAADAALGLYDCIVQACSGDSAPGCEQAVTQPHGSCGELAAACEGVCAPSCDGKQCGPDGCGGSCGGCDAGMVCVAGQCGTPGSLGCEDLLLCALDCPPGEPGCAKACADKGTPDAAATYGALLGCISDVCQDQDPTCIEKAVAGPCKAPYDACVGGCAPQCGGKQCGSDGCGGSCGQCGPGASCTPTGLCKPSGDCQPGATQCINGGVATCTPNGTWSPAKACPDGQSCQGGVCKPGVCTPKCAGKQCGPDGCGGSCGQCKPGATCVQPGVCQQTGCQPGAVKCDGNVVMSCGPDGSWFPTDKCPPGTTCSNGACVGGGMTCAEVAKCALSCPPGAIDCIFGCQDGATPEAAAQFEELVFCVMDVCDPSDPACFEEALYGPCGPQWDICSGGCTAQCGNKQCGPDGCGGSCGVCKAGTVCSPLGQCVGGGCQPGQVKCSGNLVQTCTQNGTWITVQQCPANATCKNGECIPGGCQPGATQCSGNLIQTCTDAGTWATVAQCPPNATCSNGKCIASGCKPGSTQCAGNQVQTCGPNGNWVTVQVCSNGTTCSNGQCVGGVKACGDIVECAFGCPPGAIDCIFGCQEGASQEATATFQELVSCILMYCDPADPGCFEQVAFGGPCSKELDMCLSGTCTPQCENKQCGADGCGGSCGVCKPGTQCSASGQCLSTACKPGQVKCDANVVLGCGADGTWVPLQKCAADQKCVNGQCVTGCAPKCDGVECGPDGCGGSCGICPDGVACTGGFCAPPATGSCVDIVTCGVGCKLSDEACFKECAIQATPDGQGIYSKLLSCVQDVCGPGTPIHPQAPCSLEAMQGPCADIAAYCQEQGGCTPQCAGQECGSDGCGGTCGFCPPGLQCGDQGFCIPSGSCMPGEMGCDGNNVALCVGDGQWMPLQSCPSGTVCQSGQCIGGCIPQCAGKTCGSDGCGGTCGTCGPAQQCTQGKCVNVSGTASCPELVDCALSSCQMADTTCLVGCGQKGTPQAQQQFQNVVGCVGQVCGFGLTEACVVQAISGPCAPYYDQCMGGTTCTPQCSGKQCGPDGCGGTCGICGPGQSCNGGFCSGQPVMGCYDMLVCMNDCPTDECAYQCFYDSSPEAQSMYIDLSDCLLAACGSNGDPACYEQAVMGQCGQIYYACVQN